MEPSTRLGHFEIVGSLGAGGMGEVYRARDGKLQREVALKLLPADLSDDPERLARLEREAQLLAALNHPGIAAIYSIEQVAERRFLVLELVEGETLGERLTRDSLPTEIALAVAKQIAEALEAAHGAGMIHRDLKPDNIKLTPDLAVKVLDFGLAKSAPGAIASPDTDLSQSPTLMAGNTQAGVILGTAAYMSPEQARGHTLDKRSDIWSFGVVLFEMLSGDSPYRADTLSDTLAGILKEDLDWNALPADTPPQVRRLLRRCLQKEARNRLHDIADARIELIEAIEDPEGNSDTHTPGGGMMDRPSPARVGAAVLATGLTAGILGGLIGWWQQRVETPESARAVRVQTRLTDQEILGATVVLSPDGRNLVYQIGEMSSPELHIRALDETVSRRLASGARPFFSPDGAWVAFSTRGGGGDMYRIAVSGGTPQLIIDIEEYTEALQGNSFAMSVRGGTWANDDTVIFGTVEHGLYRVPAAGGDPQVVTELREGERTHRWPWLLPDQRHLLFTAWPDDAETFDTATIQILDLSTGQRRVLLENGTDARYVEATGHLVFANGKTVYAVPFDPAAGEVTGTPVAVLRRVANGRTNGHGSYSFTAAGVLAYISYDVKPYPVLQVRRDGTESVLWPEPGLYADPNLSPDGTLLALTARGENYNKDVWVHDLIRGGRTRITTYDGGDTNPVFSPDGAYLAFNSERRQRGGPHEIYRIRADGSGEPELLREQWGWPSDWSDDGRLLAHSAYGGASANVAVLPLDGDGESVLVANQEQVDEHNPALAPNGRWVAYASNETGQFEVYVRPYPPPEGVWRISAAGGGQPRWRADGREIYFRTGDGMMAASVETDGATFAHDPPVRLFEGLYRGGTGGMEIAGGGVHGSYDVSPDGERFIMFPAAGDDGLGDAVIVANWFEELRRLVPVDR